MLKIFNHTMNKRYVTYAKKNLFIKIRLKEKLRITLNSAETACFCKAPTAGNYSISYADRWRRVFRTLLAIYDATFLIKWWAAKSHLLFSCS